jgi:hypothetical protein
VAACGQDTLSRYTAPDVGPGAITGVACDPVTMIPLPGVLVFTYVHDGEGNVVETRTVYSEADGSFVLEDLPSGRNYDVQVQEGAEIIQSIRVSIPVGGTVELPVQCNPLQALDFVIIAGTYDDEAALVAAFGLTSYEVLEGRVGEVARNFLSRPANLARFDVLFAGGGVQEDGLFYPATDETVATIQQGIVDFVDGGGILFVSDWSYDLIEQLWPDKIDFAGDDLIPDVAQRGDPGEVQADVKRDDLIARIGAGTVGVTYRNTSWPVVESVSADVDIILSGTVNLHEGLAPATRVDSPIAFRFSHGQGKVVFTTYQNKPNTSSAMLKVMRYLVE